MSNQVLIVDKNTMKKMQAYYEPSSTGKIPPGGVFAAKTSGCSITGYKSGKVLFQGRDASNEAGKWGSVNNVSPKAKSTTSVKKKTSLPSNFANLSVIGSDEVGTGDFFGPITVCAAYVRQEDMDILKHAGVKDSKALTDEKIIEIAREIIPFVPYSLLVLHNEKYNKMQQTGMTQGKMKALLHNKALENVLNKISPEKPDAILIDQFAEENVYYRHLTGQKTIVKENVYFQTKAEGLHLSVAAASIIARYAFLKEMDKLSELAQLTIPKGAGAIVDQAAAKVIKKHGESMLWQLAKIHFANSEKAKRLARK
ncbi:ribonuclease HIII [Sutcliffiella cohnii]